MILHRMAEAIREQNWFTVIIEILIVVIGIFLGFQVTEWNEQRKGQALEQTYLARLLADIDASIERNTYSKAFVANHVQNAELVLDALTTCKLEPEKRNNFASGLFHLGKIVPLTFVLGTINEIQSTGNSTILSNTQIRDLLNTISEEAQFQAALFPLVHASKEREVSFVYRHVIFLTGPMQDVDAPIKWDDIKIDFQAMCNNAQIHAAVSTVKTKGYENIDFLERTITRLAAAKDIIEEELEHTQ